jgi:hypothetical protein
LFEASHPNFLEILLCHCQRKVAVDIVLSAHLNKICQPYLFELGAYRIDRPRAGCRFDPHW